MNCWDIKQCGREARGSKIHKRGVCPAWTQSAGDACWLVAGTLCGGMVQGTETQKLQDCLQCDVYQSFDPVHRSAMRRKFASLLSLR